MINQIRIQFQESSLFKLYRSFSPASRAAILFAIPFTMMDAVHYYTAGAALIFSLPLLLLVYMLCGALAAKFACREGQEVSSLSRAGRSAAVRLWLTSTVINTLLVFMLGFATLGITLLSGATYFCLSAPLHLLGSALTGWMGGWLYQKYLLRTRAC